MSNAGQRRYAKNLARKKRKQKNLMYLVKLMGKYGKDLKLKERPKAGSAYLNWYLNNKDEKTNE